MKKTMLILLVLLCLVPFLCLIVGSFLYNGEISLFNYGILLLQSPELLTGFWRSLFYTTAILFFNVPLSVLTAYGLTRFSFKFSGVVRWLNILIMLLPFQATLVPQYLTLKALGLLNNSLAVILPNIFTTFAAFLLTQYLSSFDHTLYDAGQIDGMNNLKMLLYIVVPVARPLIIGVAALSFINYWSMVEQPLVFLETQTQMPLSVLLNKNNASGVFCAAGVVFCIMPIIIFTACHADIKQGIMLYGAKQELAQSRKSIKKVAFICGAGFITVLLAFTILTQKVEFLMTPEVSVYSLSRKAKGMSEYEYVLPAICVKGDDSPYIYIVQQDKLSNNTLVVKRYINVIAQSENWLAISGAIDNKTAVICFTRGEITDGSAVRVIKETYNNA